MLTSITIFSSGFLIIIAKARRPSSHSASEVEMSMCYYCLLYYSKNIEIFWVVSLFLGDAYHHTGALLSVNYILGHSLWITY